MEERRRNPGNSAGNDRQAHESDAVIPTGHGQGNRAAAASAAAGKLVFNRMNRDTLKKAVYAFMLVSGAFLIAF